MPVCKHYPDKLNIYLFIRYGYLPGCHSVHITKCKMAGQSYLDVAVSGTDIANTTTNGLLPEHLTLHEVLFTIRHVGGIIRKINHKTYNENVKHIRSFLTEILLECEHLHPIKLNEKVSSPMQIIPPSLWYWAIANNEDIYNIQEFKHIYPSEDDLLNNFLYNSSPFVIPSCLSFNALLQALEHYFQNLTPFVNGEKRHFIINSNVLTWRQHTEKETENQQTDNEMHVKFWFINNKTKLVEVPELPPNWIGNDPMTRPVSFNSSSTSFPENSNKAVYERSVAFRWHNAINKTTTNVVIARNTQTRKLEIFEQTFNPLLHCEAEITVKKDSVSICK